jgi:hypothetical protein
MYDKELLVFLHERLEHIHKDSSLLDFMWQLRDIINSIPKQQKSKQTHKTIDKLKNECIRTIF